LRHSASGRHIWNPDFLVQYEISSWLKLIFQNYLTEWVYRNNLKKHADIFLSRLVKKIMLKKTNKQTSKQTSILFLNFILIWYNWYMTICIYRKYFMALRVIWQYIDRSVTKKNIIWTEASEVHIICFWWRDPYNMFLVSDRSIYCHMTRSDMNYLLYYTFYLK
jgi:hypothetical protein